MAQDLRGNLDAYLSLAPLAEVSAEDAYRHVLASKGAVFERQRRLRVLRRRFQADPRSPAPGASPSMSRRSSNWRPWPWPRPIPSMSRPAREARAAWPDEG